MRPFKPSAPLATGSRLSCGALKKDSFLNLRAPSASSACQAAAARKLASGVLGDAVPEGPVLSLHLHEIDEHVLEPYPKFFVEALRHCFEKGLLQVDGAAFVERYLNKNDAVCARNIEIFGIVYEGPLLMLRDDLEVILGWDVNGVHHRAIHNRSNVFAEPSRLPFQERDPYKWHG